MPKMPDTTLKHPNRIPSASEKLSEFVTSSEEAPSWEYLRWPKHSQPMSRQESCTSQWLPVIQQKPTALVHAIKKNHAIWRQNCWAAKNRSLDWVKWNAPCWGQLFCQNISCEKLSKCRYWNHFRGCPHGISDGETFSILVAVLLNAVKGSEAPNVLKYSDLARGVAENWIGIKFKVFNVLVLTLVAKSPLKPGGQICVSP